MRIIIASGGTGGHIYPAITLAQALQKAGHKITFVGSTGRMEKDVIPAAGFDYIGLDMKIPGGSLINKANSFVSIVKAYYKCREIVKDYDLAIGFGNYISVPLVMAARNRGLKTVIHEQNSFAGKANKYLDQKVDLVIGSYEENKKTFKNPHTLILGNPQSSKAFNIKKDPEVLLNLGLDPDKKTVVIFMGSLGSQTVNKVVIEYLNSLKGDYQVIYASGKQNYAKARAAVKKKDYICVKEAVDGVKVMANSSLLVSRAGATTLSEICAMGMPSILIPSPYVPNNHQFYNAMALIDKNAALLLEEKDLSPASLKAIIEKSINDEELLKSLHENAIKLSNPKVLDEIVKEIEKL
ncbi:MAG: undecaprenyldiphospho-muramoylpentapeptide beta-N-acetylglucosaminyltransferase [Solobacterium sp.]|nr:undecaprenyldiphospho-muramoylpentapeptide beta-N-acetylglucosaminyltransferase [Solobacterium sp.]MDY2731196.1 undecaprenyldiphospho-muramoylpentapeptide beta-N-acetylglucosaminyltransferase [Erysipelotrichaceae bacterium]MCI7732217.1 undecaprenyldiphospho-muramoylpentapeptide beta-N-acetylglucosaminyltransferase [Solobacterium sp.]MDD5842470.1 undecaprenyldiphospho-muramoylpentapeptide beta-N-acetylglucosaminyltransferase [Solobacterium sp.]MDD5983053.1 undecaprenyldiphospho-muramoylpentap